MGAAGDWLARVGLLRLERSPPKGKRLVYPQAADVLARGWCGATAALVGSGGPTPITVFRDDRQAPWRSRPAGLGRSAGRHHSSLH
jgi:hypothetical protein